MAAKPRFDRKDYEVLDSETVYDGFFRMAKYTLRHRLFGGGWSEPATRELFVRGPSVGVLLYDPQADRVGLIEQFRVGALDQPDSPWLFEVVAGVVEEGEAPQEVARRELLEEAGIDTVELMPLADYLVSPGGTNERMILYCGLVSLPGGGDVYGCADENEDILFHSFSRQQVLDWLAAGWCDNAPLTIALQWLALHHEGLRRGDS